LVIGHTLHTGLFVNFQIAHLFLIKQKMLRVEHV